MIIVFTFLFRFTHQNKNHFLISFFWGNLDFLKKCFITWTTGVPKGFLCNALDQVLLSHTYLIICKPNNGGLL